MARGQRRPKKYRSKRRGRLLYQMLSLILILTALIVGSLVFFQVEHVTVEGSEKYSEEQILSVAQVNPNANLLLLPKGAIASRVEANFPYVNRVTVQRIFPTTVNIVVEECVPLASIAAAGGIYWIIDENGKILESVDEGVASTYIRVDGVTLVNPEIGKIAEPAEGKEIIFKGLCGILAALRERDIVGNVIWADLSNPMEIDIGYLGTFEVRLPVTPEYNEVQKRTEGYSMKIAALIEMVKVLDNESGTIDLRNQNGRFLPN